MSKKSKQGGIITGPSSEKPNHANVWIENNLKSLKEIESKTSWDFNWAKLNASLDIMTSLIKFSNNIESKIMFGCCVGRTKPNLAMS